MFILIDSVNRYSFDGSFDPFQRRNDAIRRFLANQGKQIGKAHRTKSPTPYGSWAMLTRETQLNDAVLVNHKRHAQSSGINNADFREIVVDQKGHTLFVHIFGDHKYVVCPEPGEYDALESLSKDLRLLVEQLDSLELGRVIIDFERVDYMNTEGLNSFIGFRKQLMAQGIELELTNLNPQLRDVMKITHLETIFKIT